MAKKQNGRPIILEVNIRVFLNELCSAAGKKVTLRSIPDRVLDEWAGLGFNAVWLMGVWTTGPLGRALAADHSGLQHEYRKALYEFAPDDVIGSPYAVQAYTVSPSLGGNDSLKELRNRLGERGMSLILDFVCNHTARDHAWVSQHPEYYIHGVSGDDQSQPLYYFKTPTSTGEKVLAYGRDPTFPGWTDTAQLNHCSKLTRKALIDTLDSIADLCDGVRCDMAMLVLNNVFMLTWGDRTNPVSGERAQGEFWREAIDATRKRHPGFQFIAEAYWNLEWELQQLGFDYTYDKVLYDRLLREGATAVRDHLKADLEYQRRSVRFIENHDEQRAAKALPSEAWQYAAATVIATVPGMVLFHEGQMEGRTIRLPVQLGRRENEPVSERTVSFYKRLLAIVSEKVFQRGDWRLLTVRPAWQENPTWQNFLAFWWQLNATTSRLVIINYAPHSGQCYVEIPLDEIERSPVEFRDLMGDAAYVRDRHGLAMKGMYFDLPPYGIHIFSVGGVRRQTK